MTCELLLGDCLELMRAMPDGAFDYVITDPPYGIGESSGKNVSRQVLAKAVNYGDSNAKWDTKKISVEHIHEMRRVSRHQVIFGGNYYADLLPASSSWIVWDKINGKNDFADCELAWTSHKKAVRQFRYMWHGMIKQRPEKRYHPTQKPLDLMKWVIENYTNEGATVLDPFMGSGTTGVACIELGRLFTGCDINAGYLAIAQQRIEAAQQQQPLDLQAVTA